MFPSDILTIASKLVKITNEQTITLSTAESCTGGLIAGAITEIPGSSSIFNRGFVTYSNLAKQQVLNVQSYQLKKFGAVSEEVSSQMASGAKLNSNSDIGIAVTGIAGPSGGSGSSVWVVQDASTIQKAAGGHRKAFLAGARRRRGAGRVRARSFRMGHKEGGQPR